MTTAAAPTISDWLSENVDSHGLYPASMLGELKPLGIEADITAGKEPHAILRRGTEESYLHLQTVKETEEQIANDPRGGSVEGEPEALLFAGYWLSSSLAGLLLNRRPGASYHGRGFAFRADINGLREAGF